MIIMLFCSGSTNVPIGGFVEGGGQLDTNLLVTSAFEPAVVYGSVFERGFLDVLTLPGSDDYDCVLCSLVTDIDFDGQKEIILGTYGQVSPQTLMYV